MTAEGVVHCGIYHQSEGKRVSLSACSCCMMMMMMMVEFALISVCALVGLFSPAARAAGPLPLPLPLHTADPVTGGERARLEAPYLHLPVFRHFRKPRFNKQHFSPAHVKGREPLPERVRQILVPAPRRHPKTRMNASGPVRVACSARRMRVRVHTASLGSSAERVRVSLGTCEARKATESSAFFSNDLHECGTQRRVMNKTVVYSNMLYYTSDVSGSGKETFSVPVQCRFNTFHYSYKIGFMPSVKALKIYKPMKTRGSVTLTACDAQWNRLSPGEGFVIGQPMYFKAETLYVPDDKRLFVHFCHVTANSSHVSTPQVKIIDNYGCLIDSERGSQSRFVNGTQRNVVRFTVDAFTLHGKVQKYLFMHCEMSIGSVVPTATSKSCTYNHLEHRWEELYGADSVCSCCNSSCVPVMP
ncbi:zona pellucida sperm-binding protein 3-like isoform X1, partial [Clarias magur]